MFKGGYAKQYEVVITFGWVPTLGNVGLVRADAISILNGHRYVFLGPYEGAYKKIRASKQKGETRVVLTGEDFSGGAALFNFAEIQGLQQEARTIGRDCLVKDLELVLDYDSLFPVGLAIPENSH